MSTSLIERPTATIPLPPSHLTTDGRPNLTTGRVAALERRCAALWSSEPHCPPHQRSAALQVAVDVERRVTELALREELTGRSIDRRFLPTIERCERELELIEPLWNEPIGRSA